MANTCTILRRIEKISQKLADLLSRPASRRTLDKIINQVRLLKGSVRELPIAKKAKRDILNRLGQALRLLQSGNLNTAFARVLAVLSILQVVVLKVQNRRVPCAQGLTIVHPSKPFSTICQICDP
ncbi:MAG: hypothetical protein GX075_08430 [Firmicutes bacterium]|nr:hypothetical protein [Bacillota bacterium]